MGWYRSTLLVCLTLIGRLQGSSLVWLLSIFLLVGCREAVSCGCYQYFYWSVAGKQFRVVVISTVRTHHTCPPNAEDHADFAFLSNPQLLTTAITRAQSLVTVIGDPMSLSTVGKCRSVLYDFYLHNLNFRSETWSTALLIWHHYNRLFFIWIHDHPF